MFAWATDAWGTHIAQWHSHTAPHTHTLEYIFIRILFSICFFFFSLFRFSLLSKSAIEICHAYRLSRTRWWGGFVSRRIPFHAVSLTVLPSVAAMSISQNVEEDTRATHYCLWRRKIMRWAIQSRKGTERKMRTEKKDVFVACNMKMVWDVQIDSDMQCKEGENDWCVKRKIKKKVRIWYCCRLCAREWKLNEMR